MSDPAPPVVAAAAPSTTRAWRLKSKGSLLDPGRMEQVSEVPLPALKPGFALIRIEYAALNPVDWKLAALLPFFLQATPRTLGADFSARIVDFIPPATANSETGHIAKLEKGQLVYGLFPPEKIPLERETKGSLQQYAVAPLSILSPVPTPSGSDTPATKLDAEQAGGLALVGLTALELVRCVKKGDRVLLIGGTTSVGLVLTDMLRSAKTGAQWITATAGGNKVDFVKSRGKVDEVLDYRAQDIPSVLKERCTSAESRAQQQFDVILDCVGDLRIYKQCAAYLKPQGVYANIGAPLSPGQGVFRSVLTLLEASLSAMLPTWAGGVGRKYLTLKERQSEDRWRDLNDFVARGDIQPVTDQIFPWEEAPAAFARLMTGRALGKVLVNVHGAK